MKTFIMFIFTAVSFSLFAFPQEIKLKTKTETFTHKHLLVLRDGKIWTKPVGSESSWKLVNGTGLPAKKHFESPTEITSIHADGNNLVALDADNNIYLLKFEFYKPQSWMWKFEIGIPFKKQMQIPETAKAWAVSHRGYPSTYYEDIDGNKFESKIGITTIYILRENGTEISFVDPWITPIFQHTFTTPQKGRFVATNFSASNSTLFIISESGEMYTRLYDYDTAGENPILSYTYAPQKKRANKSVLIFLPRRLPAEQWRKQPNIDGLITKNVTIFQHGQGNAASELRVEGINDNGQSGYFYKQIFDKTWKFQTDNHDISDPFLETSTETVLAERITRDYSGKMSRRSSRMDVKLIDFHHHTSSGTFQFTVDGKTFNAPIYVRRLNYLKNSVTTMTATIILPDSFMDSNSRNIKRLKRNFFNVGTKYLSLNLKIKGDTIDARSSRIDSGHRSAPDERHRRFPLRLQLEAVK